MSDQLRVIGNEIHYGPYVVGTLSTKVPATIRDKVERTLKPNYDKPFYNEAYPTFRRG